MKSLSYISILYLTVIATFFIMQNYSSYRDNKMLDPIITEALAGFNQNRSDISIFISGPAISKAEAKDTNEMYKQVNAFLLNSVAYHKAVPLSDDGVRICGNDACLPHILRISDKQHTMYIMPVYYLKNNKDDSFSIQFISGVLAVSIDDIDKNIKYIQNQSFFDWLKNMQWQPYFKLD